MLRLRNIAVAGAILLALIGDSEGQSPSVDSIEPPHAQAAQPDKDSTADQRGTENTPFFAKRIGTEPNAESSTKQNAEPPQQPTDWVMVGAVVGIGVLQFIAFVWQAIRLGQTISVMKDTAEGQMRAYVYLEVAGRAYPPPPKIPDRYSITLTIKNSGSTWARNVRIKHVMAVDPKEDDVFSAVKWDEIKPHPILIGPGQETSMQFGDLSGEDLRDIIASKRRVFFLARVAYEDTLSDPPITRQTQLFRQFNADEEGGVSFAWMPTHNCADDDCPKEG
jgi:hypothetical protein